MMRRSSSDKWIAAVSVLGILLLSLGLRWLYQELNPLIGRDDSLYCHIAVVWSGTGDFRCAYREYIGGTAPLYIYLLKLGVDCGIPVVTWGRILAFCFSGAFVFAFYLLGRQLFPGRHDAALICMFLAGLHPVIGRMSVALAREGPFVALAAFALVFWARAFRTGGAWSAAVCGLLLGAAVMTRHEALELLFLGAAGLLPWPGGDASAGGKGLVARFRQVLLLLSGAGLAVVLILVLAGIPVSFLIHQYLPKLYGVRLA